MQRTNLQSRQIPKAQIPIQNKPPKSKTIPKEETKIDSDDFMMIEEIICPKCSLSLHPYLLDEHMTECKYKICRYCREFYPDQIIKLHRR